MDKNNKKSELAALFDDLQDTLANSIVRDGKADKIEKAVNDDDADAAYEDKKRSTAVALKEREEFEDNAEQESGQSEDTEEAVYEEYAAAKEELAENDETEEFADHVSGDDYAAIFDEIKNSIGSKKKAKKPLSPYEPPERLSEAGSDEAEEEGIKAEEVYSDSDDLEELEDIDSDIDDRSMRSEQDDMDYQLLQTLSGNKLEIGYFGEDDVEETKKPVKIRTSKSPERRFGGLFKASAKEYTSYEQTNKIFHAYQRMFGLELIKLIVCASLFLLLIYIEIAPFLGFLRLPEILAFYNAVYILINLQILLIIAYVTHKSLVFGLKSILRSGEINLYTTASILFIVAFIHTIIAYVTSTPGMQITLFNSISALAMICVIIYNMFDLKFEIDGLKAVSSKRIKYAFSLDNNAPPEREIFRDSIPHDTAVGKIFKTEFVSNFFSRTNRYKNHSGATMRFYVYISIIAMVAVAVAHAIMYRDLEMYHTFTAAAFLFLGSVPLCSFIIRTYPIYRAQRKAQALGAAFVGSDSIEECAETAIISLSDCDVFPSSNAKLAPAGVRVYGRKNRIDTILHYMCALFATLKLPPAETFKETVGWDDTKSAAAGIIIKDIGDSGIYYETHGVSLFAGKREYIENLGLQIPMDTDPKFDEQFLRGAGSIMFLASETEVIAKIYLKYELTSNFHDIVKSVRKMGSCLCIKTFDPNIDETLLRKLAHMKKFPIRVMKLKEPSETSQTVPKAETGIAARDSLKSIISTILIANRTKTLIKSNALIQVVAFSISLIVTAGIALFGSAGLSNAGILLLLQLFWVIPMIFLSAMSS